MEPTVASGAYGVEALTGLPPKGSTPSPAIMATLVPKLSFGTRVAIGAYGSLAIPLLIIEFLDKSASRR